MGIDCFGRISDAKACGEQSASSSAQLAFADEYSLFINKRSSSQQQPEQGSSTTEADKSGPESSAPKTWEQKYQDEQKFIHDNYYSKDRLDHSKFSKLVSYIQYVDTLS